jgi:hypothetical protein
VLADIKKSRVLEFQYLDENPGLGKLRELDRGWAGVWDTPSDIVSIWSVTGNSAPIASGGLRVEGDVYWIALK